jgi:membrane carboxypeptidase/penicillin-binding protein
MGYMAEALKGVPDAGYLMPEGVVSVQVDPASGLPVGTGGATEYFYQEYAPSSGEEASASHLPAPIEERSITAPGLQPAPRR